MTRPILVCLAAAVVALLLAAPAAAHGCHRGWQQAAAQGWHRHGAACDPRPGLGIAERRTPKGRVRGRAGAAG